MTDFGLDTVSHIHFVGIKGVGMCSLALCAQDMGIKVTGSDIPELFITDKVLKERSIEYKTSFSKENLTPKPDLVITTGAHGGLNNPEVLAAKELGIPVLTHGEALAIFAKGKKMIAVCGVGGKTTTSAMIAYILEGVEIKPSYAIGVSEIFGAVYRDARGYGGRYDNDGKYFVCEADEYVVSPGVDNRPKFHLLSPEVIVVTNIKHDHPDVYPTFEDTKKAYLEFFEKLPKEGILVCSADDSVVMELAKNSGKRTFTYGFSKKADIQILKRSVGIKEQMIDLVDKKGNKGRLVLGIPGEYNSHNGIAAILASRLAGVHISEACRILASFEGSKRRFEIVGKMKSGAIIIDDYAHHPSEVENLLKATREFYPDKKITIAFQPHTYSRTKALFSDFAKALSTADRACLVDIYASAREAKDESVSSEKLAEAVKKLNKNTFYIGNLKESPLWLKKHMAKDEILLTVGAGDIFYIHKELVVSE